ncbi:EAL domain-containing protein [Blastococcus sp. MG754426]|uniref:putative bifunctional diguanylate cyclase/phosphodiesterase n=1 Tax=unclassified Blastococcus TaxID=2619396 RepID=UPI001EF03795|nr:MULTISPECIES: bifunctional diguanylate cyclase/phosphodiesterase [unclassified Blastococcus]MCF6509550.1 EAL domain-containing protein [Blastococcus sp. MG754426]MCF6512204.1 EAL domain-containing protein [Blastococcus sp. MG754427]
MRRTPDEGRRQRRGGPLWRYLAALVLLPLVGVVVLTVAAAQARAAEVAGAERAEVAVRALALLDAARSGVEQEMIPALTLSIVDDPVAAAALGLPTFFLRAQEQAALDEAARARTSTDAALERLTGNPVAAEAAAHAAEDVTKLRRAYEGRRLGIEELHLRFLAVSNDLMAAQAAAAVAATSEGVPVATMRAVSDVRTVAQLAQATARQMPLFLGSLLVDDQEQLIGSRTAWETAWMDYRDAQRRMDTLSGEPLREAWQEVRASDVVADLDGLFARGLAGEVRNLALPDLVVALLQSQERGTLLAGLVGTAVEEARSLVEADRARAEDRLQAVLVMGAGLLAGSVLGAVLLGRSVTRALRLLAAQATEISQGSLVEVEADGPREVRTVSAALGSAVAGLRRIQDQAQAVARGDLDDALLDEPLPGPLVEVVHASVRAIVTSVRQREELQFALAHRATHDPLTELPNRAQAVTLVTSALHRGRRSGEMTGLLYIDLDGFKAVNDAHGHAAGDEVLRAVAARLRAAVRPGDVVCRLGGDEFVVLVEPVHAEHDLLDLAERLIASVSRPVAVGTATATIGASIGVAVSRDGGTDADVLFAEADTAACRAKAHGRGRAEIFDETLRLQLAEQAELEAAIAHGLAGGEMHLVYQPVVDVASDRLTGYEALVRWDRPGVGAVPPDRFVPVAERSGLIRDIDRFVLGEATRQLAQWRAATPVAPGRPEPTVAVNVSGRHLADRRIVADVAEALEASGLPARLLVLEVTETVLVDDPAAYDHLTELRGMGVGIAIDDFGTGYTSIGQLRSMPVDTLKIDRSFVASAEPAHLELVALMIRAAHTFGLTVVAEGVEEQAQLARLRAEACDRAQGYLLSRPLPAVEAGALLRRDALAAPAG